MLRLTALPPSCWPSSLLTAGGPSTPLLATCGVEVFFRRWKRECFRVPLTTLQTPSVISHLQLGQAAFWARRSSPPLALRPCKPPSSQPLVPAPYQLSGSVTCHLVKVTTVLSLWSPPSTQKNLSRLSAGGRQSLPTG